MRAAISDVATGPFDGYIKFPIAVGPFQTQQDKFMTEDSKSKTAAMQGGGFYNRNSTLQAATLTSALTSLEDEARSLAVDRSAVRCVGTEWVRKSRFLWGRTHTI